MKILVVGGGGREHALIKKLKASKGVDKIYALPGNGGIAADAECVPIGAKEVQRIRDFAVEKAVDYAVVAQDDPLALGCVDLLNDVGIPCFGPDKKAAVIESSKAFSKALMHKYRIPTASSHTFSDLAQAEAYVSDCPIPVVIKADGLALGKGVVIAMTRAEAQAAVSAMMRDKVFGDSGNQIVIEEYLTGPEVSVLSFTDGETVVPMVSSMDHKRALDGDEGKNTGGMGAVAPNPCYTEAVAAECMEKIFLPTIRAMKAEGRPFKGCLYFGLMLTAQGPKVIEYNCRFGDPETQVVLPLLESDLLAVMKKTTFGGLRAEDVRFSGKSCCCVVMASQGYPEKYETGKEIEIDPKVADYVYIAGAKREGDKLLSAGGRVLGVTAVGDSLQEAVALAYKRTESVRFSNAYMRRDIGRRALDIQSGKERV